MIVKKCIYCGSEFDPGKHKEQQTCSRSCGLKAYAEKKGLKIKKEHSCPICGVVTTNKYCSHACYSHAKIGSTFSKVKIDKDELYQKYIIEQLTQRAVAEYFNTTVPTIWAHCKKHGFIRPSELNYSIGTQAARDYWELHPEEKEVRQIKMNTASLSSESRQKRSESCMGRPGNIMSEESWEKYEQTSMKNHGVPHPASDPKVREKYRQTCLELYGVPNAIQNPEITQKAMENLRASNKKAGFQSVGENEMYTFIRTLCADAVQGDWSVLKNTELDIFVPSKNIAFEYNGVYWHSDRVKDHMYHLNKQRACAKQGIRLVFFWETEWKNSPEVCKKKIQSILQSSNQETVYARKCFTTQIDPAIKNEFLFKHHIQGPDKSNRAFGLFSPEKELIAVMTFRNSRNNQETELSRYATACHIPGGFSKLLKYSGYTNITSWSDNRLSLGNMYDKTGWVRIKETPPDYIISWHNKLYHKSAFKRNTIKNKFPQFYSENLTEWEMEDLIPDCYRLWDCGKTKWKFSLTPD